MITFTKEQLIASAHARIEFAEMMLAGELEPLKERTWSIELELARIALASLEAEPYGYVHKAAYEEVGSCGLSNDHEAYRDSPTHIAVYTTLSAPVTVPDLLEQFAEFMAAESIKSGDYPDSWQCKASNAAHEYAQNIRAAMFQGTESELQRKAAIHDALCEKYNVESLADFVEWQRNHIAELEAAPPAPAGEGETAVMPDYPGYVMTQRECFQAGKKAGLAEAGKSLVIPEGWVMVPVDATRAMIDAARRVEEDGYDAMHKAMLAAAPQQEV